MFTEQRNRQRVGRWLALRTSGRGDLGTRGDETYCGDWDEAMVYVLGRILKIGKRVATPVGLERPSNGKLPQSATLPDDKERVHTGKIIQDDDMCC